MYRGCLDAPRFYRWKPAEQCIVSSMTETGNEGKSMTYHDEIKVTKVAQNTTS